MILITQEEIDDTLAKFQQFSEEDVLKLMRTFQKKQEPLLVYIAAIAEREEMNDEEYDVFITMTLMCWEVIRKKFPRLKKVTMKQLSKMDDSLYEMLKNDPGAMLMDVKDYPQPHLLGTVLTHVMEADSSEVREDLKGIIYFTLKNVLDGLLRSTGEPDVSAN
jgi:hypothetical protein